MMSLHMSIEDEHLAMNLDLSCISCGYHRDYLHKWGFAAALAVLITRASQSRQHGMGEPQLIDSLDYDARPLSIKITPSSFCVWSYVRDIRPECLWLGDIELLLVAFESQLKVFYPFKNDNTF
nr:hypothetical protein [Tanacetum cinerariifolium]